MQTLLLILLLALLPLGATAEILCEEGTSPACLEAGDNVCPASGRCVAAAATCFDDFPCDMNDGFVCASVYNDALDKQRELAGQYDQLAAENTGLREQRLEKKNCVLNASSLEAAQQCVR